MLQKAGDIRNISMSNDSIYWLDTDCRFTTADFLRMLDLSLKFESNLKFIQQPHISMEALFIKLSMLDSSIDIAHILSGGKPTIVPEKPISIELPTF